MSNQNFIMVNKTCIKLFKLLMCNFGVSTISAIIELQLSLA